MDDSLWSINACMCACLPLCVETPHHAVNVNARSLPWSQCACVRVCCRWKILIIIINLAVFSSDNWHSSKSPTWRSIKTVVYLPPTGIIDSVTNVFFQVRIILLWSEKEAFGLQRFGKHNFANMRNLNTLFCAKLAVLSRLVKPENLTGVVSLIFKHAVADNAWGHKVPRNGALSTRR